MPCCKTQGPLHPIITFPRALRLTPTWWCSRKRGCHSNPCLPGTVFWPKLPTSLVSDAQPKQQGARTCTCVLYSVGISKYLYCPIPNTQAHIRFLPTYSVVDKPTSCCMFCSVKYGIEMMGWPFGRLQVCVFVDGAFCWEGSFLETWTVEYDFCCLVIHCKCVDFVGPPS